MNKVIKHVLIVVAFGLVLGFAFAVALATWPITAVVPAAIGTYTGYRLVSEWFDGQ